MTVLLRRITLLLVPLIFSACAAGAPSWRGKVSLLVDELGRQNAAILFPIQYHNVLEAFEHGEALYHVREDHKGADKFYQQAFNSAELLRVDLDRALEKRAEERRQRAAEIARVAEEERLLREAAEAEKRLVEQQARLEQELALQKKQRDSVLQTSVRYTVRRGETLPQISARSEIYNDASLWPIIYRANRDQIRDPKRLWPGQVLTIPRNFSKDDALEARRYSNKTN